MGNQFTLGLEHIHLHRQAKTHTSTHTHSDDLIPSGLRRSTVCLCNDYLLPDTGALGHCREIWLTTYSVLLPFWNPRERGAAERHLCCFEHCSMELIYSLLMKAVVNTWIGFPLSNVADTTEPWKNANYCLHFSFINPFINWERPHVFKYFSPSY